MERPELTHNKDSAFVPHLVSWWSFEGQETLGTTFVHLSDLEQVTDD